MISSRNYSPAAKLLPFIRRHYIFDVALPENLEVEDFLMADNAFVRLILSGNVAWHDGERWIDVEGPQLCGPNSRALRVRLSGNISMVSFAIRPSAWTSLFDVPAHQFPDMILPLNGLWDASRIAQFDADVRAAPNDQAIVALLEKLIEDQMAHIGRRKVDPVVASFETIARRDSTTKVEDAARLLDLSTRQLERRCLAGFGLSPKAVLQRSRFLDMAAAMRGMSNADEAELAALRYFDQSHLNREFRRYTGMTPGAFQRSSTPLFTASLKLRVEGKSLA